MSTHFDVIVVGGGMVGATLTTALAQNSSLKIALIEAYPPAEFTPSDPFDVRVSALTKTSESLLKQIGIWHLLNHQRVCPFSNMHVWETQRSQIHFDAAEQGQASLGHIVENRNLQNAALTACRQHNNVTLFTGITPTELGEQCLLFDNGQQLTADLIVGADGANSQLRQWKGIDFKGWEYNQSGIVCTVTTEKPHQHTAWQRFLPEGPLAFLPLADPHQCSIVWTNSNEEADLLSQLDDERFKSILAKQFEFTLGDIKSVTKRAQFPLKLRHATDYVATGFALVGDAAHTIHPLAGQGVNIGLLDALSLADTVKAAHDKGRNIGSLNTLKKYQRQRKADNLMVQFTMDGLKRLFQQDSSPLTKLRQFGLSTVNKLPPLKHFFMNSASQQRID